MKKKVQVHMLPSSKNNTSAFFQNKKHSEFLQIGDNQVNNPHWQGQHLYFISDEQIEEWMLAPVHNLIKRVSDMPKSTPAIAYHKNGWRKIVATTNPDLWNERGPLYKIDIPKIGLDFVRRYVREEGNIKEVELEYTEYINQYNTKGITNDKREGLKLRSDGTVTIYPVEEKMYTRNELLNILMEWDRHRSNVLDTPILRKQWLDKNYPQ